MMKAAIKSYQNVNLWSYILDNGTTGSYPVNY